MSIPRPRNTPRRSVSDIKAAFEARNAAAALPTDLHPSKTGDLANMASKRSSLLASVSPPSIDAILDVVPAKLRPRWIGSKPATKPVTPGVEAMKIPVTIEFGSPGLQPPVYLGTTLSDPAWEPLEMEHTTNHHGEYTFRKFFAVEEGEYQYKLRLGPGDWWVCDDTKPQVDDGLGNRNNLITVKYEPVKHLAPPSPEAHESVVAHNVPEIKEHSDEHAESEPATHAPLLDHEIHVPEIKEHPDQHAAPEPATHAPLLQHETHDSEPKEHSDQHAAPEPATHAPLLDHEALSPSTHHHGAPEPDHHTEALHSETHSPLFSHETSGTDSTKHDSDVSHQISPLLSGIKTPESPVPEEANPNDPSLEKFPTDHKGIMEQLARAHQTLPEDQTSHDGSPHSSHSGGSRSLPSVKEGEEEEDDQVVAEADVPKLRIFDGDRPAGPITPPLTPKDPNDGKEKAFSDHVNDKAKAVADKIPDHVKEPAVSVLLVALGIAVAVAATMVSFWYIKAKSSSALDHMVD